MRSPLLTLVATSGLAATLASCSVNPMASFCSGSVQIKPNAIPQLVYPVPGYTKVPDNAAFIVVAYPASPALAQTITITPNGGAAYSLGPMGAVPPVVPKPHAKVLPGQGAEYAVTLPTLTPKTSYTVNYRVVTQATACAQTTTSTYYMGNFKTV